MDEEVGEEEAAVGGGEARVAVALGDPEAQAAEESHHKLRPVVEKLRIVSNYGSSRSNVSVSSREIFYK